MKFLLSYNMKIVIYWRGGGDKPLVGGAYWEDFSCWGWVGMSEFSASGRTSPHLPQQGKPCTGGILPFNSISKNPAHRGYRPTHSYKYRLTPSVMCSQQLYVLHRMNNLVISKIYFTEFHNVFAFQKLLTCRSHLSVDKIE